MAMMDSAIVQSPQPIVTGEEFPDELPKQYEIVCGILVRKAMPAFEHGFVQRRVGTFVDPFHGRQSTPGGWWIGTEVEIELFSEPKTERSGEEAKRSGASRTRQTTERYLPDVVGWRIDVVPEQPQGARIRAWPQWVCEVLSPDSTAARDRGPKLDSYHRAHVDHCWLVDPKKHTLTVLAWAEDGYQTIVDAGLSERRSLFRVRAEPFTARELDLRWLFDCQSGR